MGRAPCCDKANVKRGPWSPEEDAKLKSYIEEHGTGGNWIALPLKIGLKRCGKSCRLRWLNYLRPNIKHGGFSEEEDNIICSLYISIGSRWSIIAAQLPGRTDNDIKNYWNTRLKKKLLGKHRKAHQPRMASSSCLTQGTRKGITDQKFQNSLMVSETNNQSPYWPRQELFNNDHTSIRKLLIKLGGRFYNDNQFPVNLSSTQQQPYLPSIERVSSSSTDALDGGTTSQFANAQCQYNLEQPGMAMVPPGNSSFPEEYEEMLCNNPQRLNGNEFLYGDIVSSFTETSSGERLGWGETSTLSCSPISFSSYGGFDQQGMLQEKCTFDDLRFDGGY